MCSTSVALLGAWGFCNGEAVPPIDDVDDCFERFYPDEMEALIACVDAVAQTQQ